MAIHSLIKGVFGLLLFVLIVLSMATSVLNSSHAEASRASSNDPSTGSGHRFSRSGEIKVYLPLLMKESSPTATPTPSPTATQKPNATSTPRATTTPIPTTAPPLLAIDNGDFEQGPTEGSGWYEYRSYSNRPLIVQSAEGLSVTPRSGEWFAWLGGDNLLGETQNHQSRMVHGNTFTLPDGPVYLHAYYQIISEEQPNIYNECVYDWFFVWVNDIIMSTTALCEPNNTNGWTHGSVDLSQFARETITLEFQARTDGERLSHFLLDDISFQSAP